jgi:hypothetical protein
MCLKIIYYSLLLNICSVVCFTKFRWVLCWWFFFFWMLNVFDEGNKLLWCFSFPIFKLVCFFKKIFSLALCLLTHGLVHQSLKVLAWKPLNQLWNSVLGRCTEMCLLILVDKIEQKYGMFDMRIHMCFCVLGITCNNIYCISKIFELKLL